MGVGGGALVLLVPPAGSPLSTGKLLIGGSLMVRLLDPRGSPLCDTRSVSRRTCFYLYSLCRFRMSAGGKGADAGRGGYSGGSV